VTETATVAGEGIPGISDLAAGGGTMSAADAQAAIKDRINDKAFGDRLRSADAAIAAAAKAEWTALHKAGFPAPEPVTAEAIGVQAAARAEQEWSTFFSAVRKEFAITDEQMREVRAGVIREDLHRKAVEEKDRLVRDRVFYRRLMDGDREAREKWARITLMIGLRPVKAPAA
jgi:hypothetical protein